MQGVESILPYVTSRSVPMTQSDLVMVLSQPNPLTTELSQLAQDALELLGGRVCVCVWVCVVYRDVSLDFYNCGLCIPVVIHT